MKATAMFAEFLTRFRGQAFYDTMYLAMHKQRAFRGDTWRAHLRQLRDIIPNLDQRVILDFGCGPKGGLAAEYEANAIPYDPYVSQYSKLPWNEKVDVVFSSDVLEHMTRSQIDQFLGNVCRADPSFVFLVASTRPAQKKLPNGANAHLTVKPAAWWVAYVARALGDGYRPILATADLIRDDVSMCFERVREVSGSANIAPPCVASA
jgi:hypothetical protein